MAATCEAESLWRQARERLERWLIDKPPPVYVPREISRVDTPEALEAWKALVASLAGTQGAPFEVMYDLRIAASQGIAILNERAYSHEYESLTEASALAQRAVEGIAEGIAEALRARIWETWAEISVERTTEWARWLEATGLRLNAEADDFVKTQRICREAVRLAESDGDLLLRHKSCYHLGRVLDDLHAPPLVALEVLQEAFLHLQAYESEPDAKPDARAAERYADILHRIVRIGCNPGSADIKAQIVGNSFLQFFKNFALAKAAIKRAVSRGVVMEELVISIEGLRKGAVIPLPLTVNTAEICRRLPEGTQVVEYTLLDDRALLSIFGREGGRSRYLDPDLHVGGGWDMFMRPGKLEFRSSSLVEAALSGKPQPTTISIDIGHLGSEEESPLFWIIANQRHRIELLGPDAWRKSTDTSETRLDAGVAWSRALWQALIAPLRDELIRRKARHIVVVPDMALNLLPFHLLAGPDGELGEHYAISYAPNLSVVAASLAHSIAPPPPQATVIVRAPSGVFRYGDQEVSAVQSLAPAPVQVISGDRVGYDELRQALGTATVVHFATHGRFDSDQPERSGLMLSEGNWLTLEQIRHLTLPGSLVFLSACDTARLRLVSRVRALGVAESLIYAGASTVISTMWPVDEVPTALIVRRFYGNLFRPGAPLSRLDSLVEAITWLRNASADEIHAESESMGIKTGQKPRRYEAPYYWAGFMLYGDWRPIR